jgi:hypothetical protein
MLEKAGVIVLSLTKSVDPQCLLLFACCLWSLYLSQSTTAASALAINAGVYVLATRVQQSLQAVLHIGVRLAFQNDRLAVEQNKAPVASLMRVVDQDEAELGCVESAAWGQLSLDDVD